MKLKVKWLKYIINIIFVYWILNVFKCKIILKFIINTIFPQN